MLRNFVSFDSSHNREPVLEDEYELPPGKDVAALCEAAVRDAGEAISTEVSEHDSYGWFFETRSGDTTVSCMVQLSDEWLLITQASTPFLKRLFGGAPDTALHLRVVQAIDRALHNSGKCSDIRWYTREEFERQATGSDHP